MKISSKETICRSHSPPPPFSAPKKPTPPDLDFALSGARRPSKGLEAWELVKGILGGQGAKAATASTLQVAGVSFFFGGGEGRGGVYEGNPGWFPPPSQRDFGGFMGYAGMGGSQFPLVGSFPFCNIYFHRDLCRLLSPKATLSMEPTV